jgi:hypothetical protein
MAIGNPKRKYDLLLNINVNKKRYRERRHPCLISIEL